MARVIRLLPLLLGWLLAATGCGSPPTPVPAATGELNFASKERLHEHWLKHRGEFESGLTEPQYLAKARAFFKNRSGEKQLKERSNGDELHYLPSSNEFGVLSEEKAIRTYFRPSSGRSYWERQ